MQNVSQTIFNRHRTMAVGSLLGGQLCCICIVVDLCNWIYVYTFHVPCIYGTVWHIHVVRWVVTAADCLDTRKIVLFPCCNGLHLPQSRGAVKVSSQAALHKVAAADTQRAVNTCPYIQLRGPMLTAWSRVLLEKLTGFAANQEIPRILCNPTVHYRTHKRPPPNHLLTCPYIFWRLRIDPGSFRLVA